MDNFFSNLFENIYFERSLKLLSLTDSDILRQSNVSDHEIDIIKNLALE